MGGGGADDGGVIGLQMKEEDTPYSGKRNTEGKLLRYSTDLC